MQTKGSFLVPLVIQIINYLPVIRTLLTLNLALCQTLKHILPRNQVKNWCQTCETHTTLSMHAQLSLDKMIIYLSCLLHKHRIWWNLKWSHLNRNYKDKGLVCSCSSTMGVAIFVWLQKLASLARFIRVDQEIYDAREVILLKTICSFLKRLDSRTNTSAAHWI